MTRTIYVVFPEDSNFYRPLKKYAFLCNYDCVRKGDKIIDPRYSSSMEIVDITLCTDRVQNGLTLKDIYITMVNDKLIYQPSGLVNGTIIGSDFDIDLIKSKARKYLGENDRIHCSTPEEARKVIDIYYTLGYKWAASKKEETNYYHFDSSTIYNLEGVTERTIKVGDVATAKELDKNIIPAKEFIDYYTTNDMEKRNIQIDKETARKWYNGNDNTLKELALQAYKEDELKKISYSEIIKHVDIIATGYNIPIKQCDKWRALHKLAIIAEYLNEGWKPDWEKLSENKYYIIKRNNTIVIDSLQISNYGVVVFNSYSSAEKAIEIMGAEINNIFD